MRRIPDSAPLSTWEASAAEYGSESGEAEVSLSAPRREELVKLSCPPLLLTGAHRSGTSLFGQFFARSGVYLGERLLGPLPSNRKGHFEDLDFVELHERALQRDAEAGTRGAARLVDEELGRARQLVAERKSAGRPWGWKDPRTCLFLDFWASELPEALFVLLVRHPSLVTDSLCRRQETDSNFQPQNDSALGTWLGYNRALLGFAQRQPERCVLLGVEQALADPAKTASVLRERSGFPFEREELTACWDPLLLHSQPSCKRPVSIRLRLQSEWIYRKLQRLSAV